MTFIAIIILAIWIALVLTVTGLCLAASRGDRALQELISASPSQPDPHAAQPHPSAAVLTRRLHSPQRSPQRLLTR